MISMNQQEQTLQRLDTPRPCSIVFANDDAIVFCGKEAHWSVDGGPVCMQDIRNMAGMNSDNEEFFRPALTGNITAYFAHIAENLECIASEIEMDLSSIHTVEIIPGAPDAYGTVKDWCVHINDEQFAHIRRNRIGKCEVSFNAYYSDFDYLFRPEEAQA